MCRKFRKTQDDVQRGSRKNSSYDSRLGCDEMGEGCEDEGVVYQEVCVAEEGEFER